jgi:uncharacterized protein YhbP (UPF0306 family)
MSDPAHSDVRAFLLRCNALTLAYVDPDGVAACGLWYASDDDLNVYFLSSSSTRHGRALLAGGEVAFTIHKDEQDWRMIQGVQGRGWCAPLLGTDAAGAWHIYADRFPFVTEQFPDLEAALKAAELWRLTPSWLRLLDNARGFGHRQEIILAR